MAHECQFLTAKFFRT